MADKDVTVYIIDLGGSMGKCNNGRTESDLDWTMRYVWDKICTTVAASRKTWQVGVLGLRTDKTANSHDHADGYENISVLQEVCPMTLSTLRELRTHIRPNKSHVGDAISAIIVAGDMINEAAPQRLKYTRRIILVTNGKGPIDSDAIDEVYEKINSLGIQLTVLGVDFDDAEYGFKEEDKPSSKATNEELLRSLVEGCNNAVFGTMAQAVEELGMPRIKSTRPYKTYDGPLTLGDPENYESALTIQVERYFMTKLARQQTGSTVVLTGGPPQSTKTLDEDIVMGDAGLSAVATQRTYKVEDKEAPGGKRDVEKEELSRGYEYGRTAVHISESEFNITQLETTKSFSIIGFIPFDNYEPFLNMGDACVIVPRKFSEKDELALSALINTMYETESYAVARFVSKDGKEPQLLLLKPSIDVDFECLYDVPLPFAEDVRAYQFPPLDKVVTITGSVLTKHRLLPNDDLNKAMSDYVDAMDISQFGTDDDGNKVEYAPIDETYSPIIHRVNQAVAFRAVHPDERFDATVPEALTRFSHPPQRLVKASKPQIDALKVAAKVQKVPPKAKGKRDQDIQPISGLDVAALLRKGVGRGTGKDTSKDEGKAKELKISADNAIPELRQAMRDANDEDVCEDLARQMGDIVQNLIRTSTGDLGYSRAAENMGVLRKELISYELPEFYNDFVRDLKAKLAAGSLGGPRLEMWYKIREGNLGLIHSSELEVSKVSLKEADEFVRMLRG